MYWKELRVWEKAHGLVLKIYRITAKFPNSEKYAISSQLKQAASSVPANIVEGHSRKTSKEFIQFLYHSRGSLEELRYFLLLSKDLNYMTVDSYMEMESEAMVINKMLNKLISSVRNKHNS